MSLKKHRWAIIKWSKGKSMTEHFRNRLKRRSAGKVTREFHWLMGGLIRWNNRFREIYRYWKRNKFIYSQKFSVDRWGRCLVQNRDQKVGCIQAEPIKDHIYLRLFQFYSDSLNNNIVFKQIMSRRSWSGLFNFIKND